MNGGIEQPLPPRFGAFRLRGFSFNLGARWSALLSRAPVRILRAIWKERDGLLGWTGSLTGARCGYGLDAAPRVPYAPFGRDMARGRRAFVGPAPRRLRDVRGGRAAARSWFSDLAGSCRRRGWVG